MTRPDHSEGIRGTSERIRARALSPVSVVTSCLERIEQLNPTLNCFITVLADEALAQARQAEAEIAEGRWRGPLHGIPVGIKDFYDTAGIRTTAGSKQFEQRVPTQDAVAVARLKQAGAVIVGKTNMHELGMGTTSLVSRFGPVRNPWNSEYIAGGSSGGSAAAVAAGLCYATLDTDAIGSCRLPAACCGVVGFKGTQGLISTTGILAGEKSEPAIVALAHAAVTTRAAEDTTLVVKAVADGKARLTQRPTIGVVTNIMPTQSVRAMFDAAIEALRSLGHPMKQAQAPFENPGFDVRNIDADRKAIAYRVFQNVDVLVLPTTNASTPTVKSAAGKPLALSAENTMFANYFGLPAISIPCGVDAKGLPLGLQIVGKPREDYTVLELATRLEAARPVERLTHS